jgi:hypothetical protein
MKDCLLIGGTNHYAFLYEKAIHAFTFEKQEGLIIL